MKSMKKTLAIMLALAMALALAVPTFAADALTGSITIQDSATVSVQGKTFNAYKVLDATFADGKGPDQDGKGVAYTVPAELADFYAGRYSLDKTAPDFGAKTAAKIAVESDMFTFAKEVLAAAKAARVAPVAATAGSGEDVTSVTISNLPFGYYVVEDSGAAAPISALMLDTVGTVSIKIKVDKPVIDKKIDGDADTDLSTVGLVETNNAAIGDKVPFVLTSKVPDMSGYKKYFFVVKDTLSKGLTFNNDVAITIDGETINPSQYIVSASTSDNGETAVEIVFKNFLQYQAKAGKPIVIKYSAALNEKAVIGNAGNPNSVTLDYSHDPNKEANGIPGNPDKPGPDDADVIGTTPAEITKTFVTQLEVLKEDGEGQPLTGAEFQLAGDRLNTVLITGDKFVEDGSGTFYKLKDGSYTDVVPNEHTNSKYESISQKYRKVSETSTVTKTEHVVYKGFVNESGKLVFSGLSAGTYTLTELVAPNGYNMLDKPITVVIKCSLPSTAASGNCTWTTEEPATAGDGVIKLTVVNTTGTELPSTGGMGTTLFYVVGGLLMVGAAVLLITKKRMSSNK